jgi:hypothetical protein
VHLASQPPSGGGELSRIRLFSWNLRIVWVLLFCLTLGWELIPAPGVAPWVFYTLKSCKGLTFVLLGFVSPMAFWRFDSLGFGVLFSCVAAGVAEMLQSMSYGHRASPAEFLLKLLLLFLGFAFSLSARYDRKLSFGPFSIGLIDSHLTEPE